MQNAAEVRVVKLPQIVLREGIVLAKAFLGWFGLVFFLFYQQCRGKGS